MILLIGKKVFFLWNGSTLFSIQYMEPGFSASCLHSILSSASHKHSSSLSSRLHHSCLSSPTCCTLLPASPTMITFEDASGVGGREMQVLKSVVFFKCVLISR